MLIECIERKDRSIMLTETRAIIRYRLFAAVFLFNVLFLADAAGLPQLSCSKTA